MVFFVVVAANASGTSVASNCQSTDLALPPFDPLQVIGAVFVVGVPAAVIVVGIMKKRKLRLKRKL